MNFRGLVYLFSLFFLLGLIALAGIEALYHWQVYPLVVANQEIQYQFRDMYIDDLDHLANNKLLGASHQREISSADDAGPFLNLQLYWMPKAKNSSDDLNAYRQTPLVPVEVRESLLRIGGEWMRKNRRVLRLKADFSFFDQVSSYAFWDLEGTSPIASLISQNIFVLPSQLPIPESSDLIAATKLRLMKGAVDGQPLLALQQVRQFVRLLLTTENLQMVQTALVILDHERKAYQYYVDELNFDDSQWEPIDHESTHRAQRAVQASHGYLHLWTSKPLMDKLFLSPDRPLGYCAVLNENLPLPYSVRPLLEPQWPLERSYRSQYKELDEIFSHGKTFCRLKYLRHFSEIRNFSIRYPGPMILNKLPYSRKLFGLKLLALNFSGFDPYIAMVTPMSRSESSSN